MWTLQTSLAYLGDPGRGLRRSGGPHYHVCIPYPHPPPSQGLNHLHCSAKLDGTENDLPVGTPFQLAGFPTLKFKPAGSREFLDYKGDRSVESLIEFIQANSNNNLTHPTKTSEPEEASNPEVPPAPTPEVIPEDVTPEASPSHAPREDL